MTKSQLHVKQICLPSLTTTKTPLCRHHNGIFPAEGGGGGVLHYICLIGMCRHKGVWTLPILVSIWVRYSREFRSTERVCRLNGQIEREIE